LFDRFSWLFYFLFFVRESFLYLKFYFSLSNDLTAFFAFVQLIVSIFSLFWLCTPFTFSHSPFLGSAPV